MKWASTFDTDGSLQAAVEHGAAKIFRDLDKREPDLVLAFVSSEHAPQYEALPELLSREFESAFIVGCCAEGVIGAGKEVEDRPALALTAAVLPDVRLVGRHLETAQLPPAYAEPGTTLAVDIFGDWVAAEVRPEPLYDPKGERVRA